jgi:hypothetical protein
VNISLISSSDIVSTTSRQARAWSDLLKVTRAILQKQLGGQPPVVVISGQFGPVALPPTPGETPPTFNLLGDEQQAESIGTTDASEWTRKLAGDLELAGFTVLGTDVHLWGPNSRRLVNSGGGAANDDGGSGTGDRPPPLAPTTTAAAADQQARYNTMLDRASAVLLIGTPAFREAVQHPTAHNELKCEVGTALDRAECVPVADLSQPRSTTHPTTQPTQHTRIACLLERPLCAHPSTCTHFPAHTCARARHVYKRPFPVAPLHSANVCFTLFRCYFSFSSGLVLLLKECRHRHFVMRRAATVPHCIAVVASDVNTMHHRTTSHNWHKHTSPRASHYHASYWRTSHCPATPTPATGAPALLEADLKL